MDEVAAALTRQGIPFAFVSGYGRENLPAGFASAGIVGKPFSPRQLLDEAARLVEPRADVIQLRTGTERG
nr:hypothetical protein [Methylobrevis pamukkalensis]